MMRSFRLFLITLLLLFLFSAPAVFATAGEDGPMALANAGIGMVYRVINFLIVAVAIVWVFRKLRPAFRGKADDIGTAIHLAAAAKAEADRKLHEAEEKMARLDQEVAGLRAVAQRDLAAEAARIRALAQEEAKKVERAADGEIEASGRAARMELKALAARLAVERAEALIRIQLTPDMQAAILRAFVDDLGRSAN